MLFLLKHKHVYLVWRLSNYKSVSPQINNLIKLTRYDETKKMAHDSQIVKAIRKHKLNHG